MSKSRECERDLREAIACGSRARRCEALAAYERRPWKRLDLMEVAREWRKAAAVRWGNYWRCAPQERI